MGPDEHNHGAIHVFRHWQFIAALIGIAVVFGRLETKVQAMEPLQQEVKEITEGVGEIKVEVGKQGQQIKGVERAIKKGEKRDRAVEAQVAQILQILLDNNREEGE